MTTVSPAVSAPVTGLRVETIATPSLGDRSYLVTDGETALVIDPQRDIDRVLDLARQRGVTITHVLETHIHNDYVTGGLALARAAGAAYYVNGADAVSFDRERAADGDVIAVGPAIRLQVIATPGHTFTHLAYALEDVAAGRVVAVFTGGSLLYGSTGRTDLLGAQHAATLAAAQHASARRLAAALPASAAVYPTHGFGSFCAASPAGGADRSTLGEELGGNPALTQDAGAYVAGLLAGLDAYPAYYARMAPANAAGPAAPALTPPAVVEPAGLAARIAAGEWVVDLRARSVFATGHVPGSLSFEHGDAFLANLGWLLPPGAALTLIGASREQVAAAQRDLARIGIDRLAGAAVGLPPAAAPASYPVSDFTGLAAAFGPVATPEITVLDVRRRLEWAGGHIDGAVHVPLHELPARLPGLPPGPLWVHCQAGYRAAVAASLLHAAGRAVTAVDDSFDHAAAAGLPVTAS
jgi:hydroxyacylglutathione hydrolase